MFSWFFSLFSSKEEDEFLESLVILTEAEGLLVRELVEADLKRSNEPERLYRLKMLLENLPEPFDGGEFGNVILFPKPEDDY